MSKKILLASREEELEISSHIPDTTATPVILSETQVRQEEVLSLVRTSVNQCLTEQREIANREPGIKKFRQLNPHMQRAYMENMPARLFYYLERAFSLPEDYREFTEKTSRNEEKKLISSLVFHPEFFTDDFLISLGACKKEDLYRRRIATKLEQRIIAIPSIKEVFAHTEQLPFRERGNTARIVRLHAPMKPWDGKYVVFQERSDFHETPQGMKRKTLTMVPHIFDDIFSVARSQEKATDSILHRSNKVELLKQKIDSLLLRWYDLVDTERIGEIQELREELQSKKTFLEISALKGRIEKIDFSNNQVSTGRLIGAWNDLAKSYGEKIGKTGVIFEQACMLRNIIGTEINRLEIVYNKFFSILSSIDHKDIEKSVRNYQEGNMEEMVLSPIVRNQLRAIIPTLREYVEFHGRQPFVGKPFSQVYTFIGYIYNALKDSEKNDNISVRTILIATLHLKLHKVRIGVHTMKDNIRSTQIVSEKDRKEMTKDVEGFLTDLQTLHFLKDTTIGGTISLKFTEYITSLESMKQILNDGDIHAIIKQINDTLVVMTSQI